jgi:hypothetical protein
MPKWLNVSFSVVILPLMAVNLVLMATGASYPTTMRLGLLICGLMAIRIAAKVGRSIARHYAQPRRADGPEADYHDPSDTL